MPTQTDGTHSMKTLDLEIEVGKTTYEHGDLTVKIACTNNLIDRFKAGVTKTIIERVIERVPDELIDGIKAGRLMPAKADLPFDIKAKISIGDIFVKVGNVNVELTVSENKTIGKSADE
jgi:hypothetical protein